MFNQECCCRCWTRRQVVEALDLDTPPTSPVDTAIQTLARRSPERIRSWLSDNTAAIEMIRSVQTEHRDFQHRDLDALDRPGVTRQLRQEFIAAGLLPDRHHGLDLFDTWTAGFLATIEHPDDRNTLHSYIRWSQRRRLETAIEIGTIKAGSFRVARRCVRAASRFLVSTRDTMGDPAACDQHHIDQWFAEGNTNTQSVISFLTWAQQQRIIDPTLVLPVPESPIAVGMSTDERVEIVRRLLATTELSAGDRFAGLLVTIYAQPVTRVSRMRRDDIDLQRRPATARLGRRAIELDPHVAAVCADHLAARDENSEWLFPGRVAGQPVSSHGLGERLRRHGVTKAARISALHDLTRKVPSTILADLIGYNRVVLANRADTLAEPWQAYAAVKSSAMPTADSEQPRW